MNEDEIRSRLAKIFGKVLGYSGVLRDEVAPGDIAAWDSIVHVTLVIAAEKEFKIKFKAADITGLTSVGAWIEAIQNKTSGSQR